jgi:single-stranded-DNA-specific exonuclease
VDLRLESREINAGMLDSLAPLAPHGKGNPVPRIWIQQARISDVRVLKDRHLKARLHHPGGEKIDLIWWGGAEHRSAFEAGGTLDLLGTLSWNHWRGRSTLQITLEDARLES